MWAMTGPLAVYAGTATASTSYAPPPSRAYAAIPLASPNAAPLVAQADAGPVDQADRAFDGGGLVTPDAPTGAFAGSATLALAPVGPAPVVPRRRSTARRRPVLRRGPGSCWRA